IATNMLRVSNCFCCCSLKYGFLTFAVISLLYRICTAVSLFYVSPDALLSSTAGDLRAVHALMPGFGFFAAWYAGTAALLALAIKGIFDKRSIYMYPYIVVLIVEIIVLIIVSIILAVKVTPWFLINTLILAVVNIYAIICLTSLYKNNRDYEKNRPPMSYDTVPLKTV
ncbi:hypothetical protein ILUMI_14267, partial [Ignelater luminosus]